MLETSSKDSKKVMLKLKGEDKTQHVIKKNNKVTLTLIILIMRRQQLYDDTLHLAQLRTCIRILVDFIGQHNIATIRNAIVRVWINAAGFRIQR